MSLSALKNWPNFNRIVKAVVVFLNTSWISLLMIFFVVLLLTQMDQGPTIVVDLLSDWQNLLLFHIMGPPFVLLLAHYPSYLYLWREENNLFDDSEHEPRRTWEMPDGGFLGLGLICYKNLNTQKQNPKSTYSIVKGLWTVMSAIIIFMGLYVLFFCYKNYINPGFPLWWALLIAFLIFLIIFFILRDTESFEINTTAESTEGQPETKKSKNEKRIAAERKRNQRMIYWFYGGFTLTTLLVVFNVFAVAICEWSFIVFVTQWAILLIGAITMYLFIKVRPYSDKKLKKFWLLRKLTDSMNYLRFFRLAGFFALLFFVSAQIWPTEFSPINIILCFLILLYGIIIIPIKHRFYYRSIEKHELKTAEKLWQPFFLYVTPFIPALFIVLTIYTAKRSNALHSLPRISESSGIISEKQYIKALQSKIETNNKAPIHFIGTYGGGLKSNIWTMLVLDSLVNKTNILDRTVAMSGVSGGSMGLACYSSIMNTGRTGQAAIEKIESIANGNFLSRDLAWLMGWDLIRQYPNIKDSKVLDRSKQSIVDYSEALDDPAFLEQSYRSYWHSLYEQHQWPILLTNSSGTHYRKGVSCSLPLDNFDAAFPGSIDLLTMPNKHTLRFGDAVSCSNRFPMVSPGAKIPNKGVFLDGGYYENSGMMSLLSLYEYFRTQCTELDSVPVKFIQIMPHKFNYIETQFGPWWKKFGGDQLYDDNGELSSVLKAGIELNFVPQTFDKLLEEKARLSRDSMFQYQRIALPYKVSREEVLAHFGLHEVKGDASDTLDSLIKQDNDRLDEILLQSADYLSDPKEKARQRKKLRWDVTEPSTARILGPRTWRYFEYMIKGGDVFWPTISSKK